MIALALGILPPGVATPTSPAALEEGEGLMEEGGAILEGSI